MSGIASSSIILLMIFNNHVSNAWPPNFRCSAKSPSWPDAFLFFSFWSGLGACSNSSTVKGVSSRYSLFNSDSLKRDSTLSFTCCRPSESLILDLDSSVKWSAHMHSRSSLLVTRSLPTFNFEQRGFLLLGAQERFLAPDLNRFSLLLTRLHSSIAAQRFTCFFTSRRQSFFES